MKGRDFRDLLVWKKAFEFFLLAVEDTSHLPKNRVSWVMTDQLLRASNSIGANVAEGYGRKSSAELRQFLSYAKGSTSECLDQYYKLKELKYITGDRAKGQIEKLSEIDRMLRSFICKLM